MPREDGPDHGLHLHRSGRRTVLVVGGETPYIISADGKTCTCPAFVHHKNCKHLWRLRELRTQSPSGFPYKPRFQLYTNDDLRKLPPPSWVLQNHVPKGGLFVVYGQPGHGKTFLGLDWTLSISTGHGWLGNAVQCGPTVYVSTEGGWGLAQRIQAWQDSRGVPDLGPAYFVREAVNLLEADHVTGFLEDVRHAIAPQPAMIMFDTLHGSMVGGDENTALDMGAVVESCRRISRTTGAATGLAHHMGKDARWERGSGSLRAAADVMFKVELDEDGVLTLTNDKQRDAPELPECRLRLATVGGSCVIEPLERDVTPLALTTTGRKMLRTLLEVGEASANVWLKASKANESTFYRVAKLLYDGGYANKLKGRYAITDLGRNVLKEYAA